MYFVFTGRSHRQALPNYDQNFAYQCTFVVSKSHALYLLVFNSYQLVFNYYLLISIKNHQRELYCNRLLRNYIGERNLRKESLQPIQQYYQHLPYITTIARVVECFASIKPNFARVDQFAITKFAKNTHDPCQNAIVRSQRSTFLLILLIRKGFSPAKIFYMIERLDYITHTWIGQCVNSKLVTDTGSHVTLRIHLMYSMPTFDTLSLS